MTFNCSKVGF